MAKISSRKVRSKSRSASSMTQTREPETAGRTSRFRNRSNAVVAARSGSKYASGLASRSSWSTNDSVSSRRKARSDSRAAQGSFCQSDQHHLGA